MCNSNSTTILFDMLHYYIIYVVINISILFFFVSECMFTCCPGLSDKHQFSVLNAKYAHIFLQGKLIDHVNDPVVLFCGILWIRFIWSSTMK